MSITDTGFDRSRVTVGRGGTVVWDNLGTIPRGAVDASAMAWWNTGFLAVSTSGWKTFVVAGVYRYDDAADASHRHRGAAVPHPARDGPTFTVSWASAAPAGFAYDVQIRRPGAPWRSWKTHVTRAASSFRPGNGRGTYRFRARLVKLAGGHAGWSPADAVRVG